MKHIILLSLLLTILVNLSFSQNVGINNTDPKATLDVAGDIVFRAENLNLVNGINDNIDIITTKSMNYIIMGPNTTFEIGGFAGGENGRIITLYNSSPAAYYVKHFSGGTLPENQINTGIGADFLMNSYSTLTFQYLALDNLWHVVSSFGKIESNTSNTTLSSTPSDTSILANFNFTTGITSILDPLNTMPGNLLLLGLVDDQSTANLPLPFNVVFDGKTYANFSVCANGFIRLYSNPNQSTTCTHINDLNSTNVPLLAPLWDDLRMFSPDGGVWSFTEGNSPDRTFHIEFICSYFSQAPVANNLRFRVSFFESNNAIKYTYFQTANAPYPGNGGFTIGMRSEDLEFCSVDAANNIANNLFTQNNNYQAPVPGRYYCWEQNLTPISNISINSPFPLQNFNINGNLDVSGNLSKSSGSFKIDHPVDPENMYLYHSFVESPDMMNIYNGNILTDNNGVAIVQLPDYFFTLNKDFRYQLTAIGQPSQVFVLEEINNTNKFKIKSDKAKVKISWQVTGVRQDAWANTQRIVPEVDKEEYNKGKYLVPEAFGQPKEKRIHYTKKNLD